MSSGSEAYSALDEIDLRRIGGSGSHTGQSDAAAFRNAHRIEYAAPGTDGQRRRRVIRAGTFILSDLAALAAAIATAFAATALSEQVGLRGPGGAENDHTALVAVGLAAMLVCVLSLQGRYSDRIGFTAEAGSVWSVAFAACAMVSLLGAITSVAVTTWLFACLTFPIIATAIRWMAAALLVRSGYAKIAVLFVGDAEETLDAEAALNAGRMRGYAIVGHASTDALGSANGLQPLRAQLARHGAEHLLIAANGEQNRRLAVTQALRERVDFSVMLPSSVVPGFAAEANAPLSCGTMMLSPRHGHRNVAARAAKAAFDVAGAAILLVILAPVLLIIAVLVRRDGGPALYAHHRLGSGARTFPCMKFRTMVVNGDAVLAEALARDPRLAAEWAAVRKLRNDPRVTPLGRFLRKTSLDELPQLINVLRLEMSLVGPRPIVSNEVPFYGADIAHYYAGRPGLTGLWQVSGRSNTSYQRRVQLDVWYVTNWSLWSDFMVLLKTIPAVLAGDGAT